MCCLRFSYFTLLYFTLHTDELHRRPTSLPPRVCSQPTSSLLQPAACKMTLSLPQGVAGASSEPLRSIGAWGSIALLISVAAGKTLLTKYIFVHEAQTPIAYSLLSACVTAMFASCHGFGDVRFDTVRRLAPIALAIAIDLGLSNVAISRLPLALQQAIASTIPAFTIVLETLVRRRCKPCIVYVVIFILCFGAGLGHLGSLPPFSESRAHFWGEAAMVVAVLAAACKYVFAKDLLHAYRQEIGALRLLLWLECLLCTVLLPWSLATNELRDLLSLGLGAMEWSSLCLAGALGGFRFYIELIVLRHWSATTLSAANLSAHSLIIVLSIPIFDTPITPFLVAGTAVTLCASALYGWIKITRQDVLARPIPAEDEERSKLALS